MTVGAADSSYQTKTENYLTFLTHRLRYLSRSESGNVTPIRRVELENSISRKSLASTFRCFRVNRVSITPISRPRPAAFLPRLRIVYLCTACFRFVMSSTPVREGFASCGINWWRSTTSGSHR